jgi:hypothetical protein
MCIDVYIDKVLVYTSCETENATDGYNISNITKVLNKSIVVPSPIFDVVPSPNFDVFNNFLSPSIAPAVHTTTTPSVSIDNMTLINATPSSHSPIMPVYIENNLLPVLLITTVIVSAVVCLFVGICCCSKTGKIYPKIRQLTHLRPCCSSSDAKTMLPMKASAPSDASAASEKLSERVQDVARQMREAPMITSPPPAVPKRRPHVAHNVKTFQRKLPHTPSEIEKPPPIPKRAIPMPKRAIQAPRKTFQRKLPHTPSEKEKPPPIPKRAIPMPKRAIPAPRRLPPILEGVTKYSIGQASSVKCKENIGEKKSLPSDRSRLFTL